MKLGIGINIGSSKAIETDTIHPVAVITCAQTSPTVVSPLNFTITFNEPVTGFTVAGITAAIVGGTVTKSNFAGSGAIYTCDLVPSITGIMTVDVLAGVCADLANNPNIAASQFSITTIVFTYRDEFTTAVAAPIPSPRTSTPGPGLLTIGDTSSSISGGNLIKATSDTITGFPIVTRSAGQAAIFWPVTVAGPQPCAGWTKSMLIGGKWRYLRYGSGYYKEGTSTVDLGFLPLDTPWILIQRSAGLFIVIDNILMFVDSEDLFAQLAPMIFKFASSASYQYIRMVQLPAPWNDDYGIVTQRLAGIRTVGDTLTHLADCLLNFTMVTRPSSGIIDFRFRQQDTNNYWQVTINSTGLLSLNEVVAGVPTARGAAAVIGTSNDIISIHCIGNLIRVYTGSNSGLYITLRFAYTSTGNFSTATQALLSSEGTGGDIRDMVSWPRVLTGEAASILSLVTPLSLP